MSKLTNKTLFVSGASRGIGLAIAKKAAEDGANVILAANSNIPQSHNVGLRIGENADQRCVQAFPRQSV